MWSTLSKFFGLVNEEEGTSTDKGGKGASGAEESLTVSPQREWREFDGLVTSLHSSYGLIDNEVYFTHDVVTGGVMPRVGDTVHVKASRKHQVGGWKAECVTRMNASSRSWDNDWEGDEDEEEDGVEEEEGGSEAKTEESKEKARRLREKRAVEKAALAELVADKMDVSITKLLDFGQMEIGKTKSLKIEIKNEGLITQTLCGWSFKSQSVSAQFELSPIRLLTIDLKQSSRKAQETLPMTLDPGKAAVVTVYCNARYLGLDQQIVVFEFEGFAIGRKIEVTVLDLTQLDLQPVAPYRRSQAAGRYQQTKEAWIVPGQRPNWGNPGAKIPKRLPQHPVPEFVRKCLLEQKEVTTVLPVLVKPLLPENYAARISALLFLEEIQQEIDIREFDLDSVSMHVVGEFLALRIPGLAEGRPSLLIGDRAIMSEPEESVLAPSYEGIIHEVLKDEVHLKFCEDFHNSYSGKVYNVRFIFSRTNFRRCHTAAEYASKLKSNILFPKSLDVKVSQMHSAISGISQPAIATVVKVGPVIGGIRRCPARPQAKEIYAGHVFFNDLLNARQRSAVFRVLQGQGRPTPYIIFGPPGTGKTVTVVECILQIFYHLHNGCILACTPSNSAADLLTERLHQSGLVHVSDMVRVNAFQRGQENVVESVRPYCADVDDLKTIKTKRIVVCTCSTAGMFYGMDLPVGHFSHVFVDEAGQATEPECMIPVGLVAGIDGQIVLAGDPLQLGPVLRSNLAKDYGLQISYLERLSHLPLYTRDASKYVSHGSYDPLLVTKLVENYRSHPALLNLSSEIFYDGELVIAADKYLVECLCSWEHLPNKNSFPVLFHGIRGEDLREGNSPSWFNPQEAIQVMKYLQSVVHNDMYQLTYDDVGIITPYRKQVEKIRLLIDRLGMEKVKVGSVEEFQGQERLVMIISTVRSTESLVSVDLRYTLGFLSNPKRFNVSITRAHALLIIVGNPHVLSQDFYWCKLLQYCVANNAYVGCDLPDIGNLKSRINSRRFSDDTVSSSEEGETAKQREKEDEGPATNLNEADNFSGMTGNVSESLTEMSSHASSAISVLGDTSAARKDCSKESAGVDLVPSGNLNSVEMEEPDVCVKENDGSFLRGAKVDVSGGTVSDAVPTDACVEGLDIDVEETKHTSMHKPHDVVNGDCGDAIPASRDSLDDPASVDKQMQLVSIDVEGEHRPSETLVADGVSPNPVRIETVNVKVTDSKTETDGISTEVSILHQESVKSIASKNRMTRSNEDRLPESKDPSELDSVHPRHIFNKFVDRDSESATVDLTCSEDSVALSDKLDVAGDPSTINRDENALKHFTDGPLQSNISTVEENASKMDAELQTACIAECNIIPACNEAGTNRRQGDVEDSVLAADTLRDDVSTSEVVVTKFEQQLTGPCVVEKERNICQAIDELQGKERTSRVEEVNPIAPHMPAAANYSIASLKLDLPIKEEPCHAAGKSPSPARKSSMEGAYPSGEPPAKVFTDESTLNCSENRSTASKEPHLSATDFMENNCENIERARLSDFDSLKPSFELFDKPLPCKDSNVSTPVGQLEDVPQGDEPNSDGRSLVDVVVLDRGIGSATSDVSLDVCVLNSISSAQTLCADDMFDYEKSVEMHIMQYSDTSEPCVYVDKSVIDAGQAEDISTEDNSAEDNSAEDNPAEDNPAEDNSAEDNSAKDNSAEDNSAKDNPPDRCSHNGSNLSTIGIIPHPSAEVSKSNVVNGGRVILENLDDVVFEEDAHVSRQDSDICGVASVESQASHSGSAETAHCPPEMSGFGISMETHVEGVKAEMSRSESRGSEVACEPDCDAVVCDSHRKSSAGNEESSTENAATNISDHSKTIGTIGTGDAFETINEHQKLVDDRTAFAGVVGVPVKGSISEPSLGVSVPHVPDSHLPAKSASQTTTAEVRTERNFPYGPMSRGFSSQRRRGGFEREAGRFSSRPFDRRGQGRGHFQAGPRMDGVPSSVPDATENLRKSPADNDVADTVRSDRGNGEMERTGRTEETGGRRNFRDARRSSHGGLADEPEEDPVEVEKKIIHQMEYYFGDFNLMRDGFLQEQIARDIDGWVDLSVIATFNRMKALTTNFKVICDALRKSTSGVVEVSDDDTKVRRSSQKPLNNNMDSWLKDLKTRAAVIKNYPSSETIDNMQSFFETYGGVAHIERGISKRAYHRGPSSSGRPSFELVDLVIFLDEDGLKNLAKRRYTTLKRMGLNAWFTDELSDQCVDYFYKRRVQGVPRQSLQPVGFSGSIGDTGIKREPTTATDGANSNLNRNRPYQSSSLQSQKFRSNASHPTSQHDDRRSRTSASDAGITPRSADGGDDEDATAAGGPEAGQQSASEMKIRPLMEIDAVPYQRQSTGYRTSFRRPSNQQFANRSCSDSSNAYQRNSEHKATTEQPWSPRSDLDRSDEKPDIDKLLSNIDNMSFSRRKPYSPTHQSPADPSAPDFRVNTTTQDVGELSTSPQKPTRQSRKVKCFDPEFSFELAPATSAFYDNRPPSETGRNMAPTAETDSISPAKPFVSSPSQSIPEMSLISLTVGAEWSSAALGQLLQEQLKSPEGNTHGGGSSTNRNLDESQVSDENLSYSLLSDQRDDDIIIESCCEEDLEAEETSDGDDDAKGGWE